MGSSVDDDRGTMLVPCHCAPQVCAVAVDTTLHGVAALPIVERCQSLAARAKQHFVAADSVDFDLLENSVGIRLLSGRNVSSGACGAPTPGGC